MIEKLALDHYQIHIGSVRVALAQWLAQQTYSSLFLVVDQNTRRYCMPLLEDQLHGKVHVIEVAAGERHKNLQSCTTIWQQMMQAGADRQSLCINLGGGVIGDMGGFCAATFKRGLRFVQVPTTLLSMVDASIGGKLGVDFEGVKNSIGLFCDPAAVFIDPVFLNTLPARELRSGFAEVIKHTLIADSAQWQQLQQVRTLEKVDWPAFLLPSLNIKRRIVMADPLERHIRKALNFGHTIGHAIEAQRLQTKQPLLHGEAIAIGMICEAWLSTELCGLSQSNREAITSYVLHHFGKVELDSGQLDNWLGLMKKDKKNRGRAINCSLLSAIGEPAIDQICTENRIKAAILYYQQLPNAY